MTLLATVLADYATPYGVGNLDWAEKRFSTYGIFEHAKNDASNLIPLDVIKANKTAETRPMKVTVKNGLTLSTSATRSINITAADSTSAFVTLSYATLRVAFDMKPAIYANNYVGYQADFKDKMDAAQHALMLALDGLGYTKLNTDKAQYNAAAGNPYTLNASNDIEVAYADRKNFLNEVDALFAANDLNSVPLNIVANPRTMALVREIQQSAMYNAENKALVLEGKNFLFSNRVTNASPAAYTLFAMTPGALALGNWNDIDAQTNQKGENGEATIMNLPLMGMDMAIFRRRTFADLHATYSGLDRSMQEGYELSSDFYFLTPYNSSPTTKATPIYKVLIAGS